MQDTLLDETEHWELNVYLPYDYFLFTVESWTNSQKTLQKKLVKKSSQKSRQMKSSKKSSKKLVKKLVKTSRQQKK